jgi:hypothetical protein
MSIQRLFIDIETVANPDMVALLPEPKAPSTYKDPEKIAAYVAEKKVQQLAEAALDPDTGRVAAVGIMGTLDLAPQAYLAQGDVSERRLLTWAWGMMARSNGNLVGYNLLGFDIPFMLRRSMALGIKPPMLPFMARYRMEPITDLYAILYSWQPGKGLKAVCRMYGIHNALPELDGSQVAGMDAATRRKYVCNDVLLTAALFEKMNGIYFSL